MFEILRGLKENFSVSNITLVGITAYFSAERVCHCPKLQKRNCYCGLINIGPRWTYYQSPKLNHFLPIALTFNKHGEIQTETTINFVATTLVCEIFLGIPGFKIIFLMLFVWVFDRLSLFSYEQWNTKVILYLIIEIIGFTDTHTNQLIHYNSHIQVCINLFNIVLKI